MAKSKKAEVEDVIINEVRAKWITEQAVALFKKEHNVTHPPKVDPVMVTYIIRVLLMWAIGGLSLIKNEKD